MCVKSLNTIEGKLGGGHKDKQGYSNITPKCSFCGGITRAVNECDLTYYQITNFTLVHNETISRRQF